MIDEDLFILASFATLIAVLFGLLYFFPFSRNRTKLNVPEAPRQTTPTQTIIDKPQEDEQSEMEKLLIQRAIREKQQEEYSLLAKDKEQQRIKEELQKIDDDMKRLKLGEYRLGKGYKLGGAESPTKDEYISKQQQAIDELATQKAKEAEIEENMRKEKQEMFRQESINEEERKRKQHEDARRKQQEVMDNRASSYSLKKETMEKENLQKRLKELEDMKVQKQGKMEEYALPKSEIDEDRMIRQQQELEYQKSLEADEEKAILKMIAEQSIKEEQERVLRVIESRKNKAKSLIEEPIQNEQVMSIGIKFPSGKRASRRFLVTQRIQEVIDFVEGHLIEDEFMEQYSLLTNFPRKDIVPFASSQLSEVFMNTRSEILFVERL